MVIEIQAMLTSDKEASSQLYQATAGIEDIDLPALELVTAADEAMLNTWAAGLGGYDSPLQAAIPALFPPRMRKRPTIKVRLGTTTNVSIINHPVVEAGQQRLVYGRIITEVVLQPSNSTMDVTHDSLEARSFVPPSHASLVQVRIYDRGTGALGNLAHSIINALNPEYRDHVIVHSPQLGGSFSREHPILQHHEPARQLTVRVPTWVAEALHDAAESRLLSALVNANAAKIGWAEVVASERNRKAAGERLNASMTVQASSESITHALQLGVEAQELVRVVLTALAYGGH